MVVRTDIHKTIPSYLETTLDSVKAVYPGVMSLSPWLFKCWGKLARGAQEGLEFVVELARTPVPLTVPNKYFELKNSWGANGAPQTRTTC